MRKIWLIALFMLMPSIALAASNGGPMSTLFGDIIQIAAYAAALIGAAVFTLAGRWIAAKFKIAVPSAWMANANNWLDKGIAYAEQWAKNQVAQNKTVNGSDKMNTAVQFILTMCDDKSLVSKAESDIQKLIEARLGEQNGGSNGALIAQVAPDVKLLATHEDGRLSLHMTDGSEHEISKELAAVGYVKAQTRIPQAGFSRIGVLIVIAMLSQLLIIFAIGCATLKGDAKEAASDLSTCAKAEVAAVKQNISVVQVALDVVDIIGKLVVNPAGEATSLLTDGLTKYGEPLVACAFNKFETSHQPTTRTAQPDPRTLAAHRIITDRNWSKYSK